MIYLFYFLLFLVFFSLLFFIFILFWFLGNILSILFLTGIPPVQTDKKYFKQIFSQLNINEKTVICDLGCGGGNFLLYSLNFNPKKVIGYELSFWPYLSAKLKSLIWGRNKMKIYFKDFFKVNLEEVDVIYIYLTKPLLERVFQEIIKKIKTQKIIIVKGMALPNMTYCSKIVLDDKRSYFAYIYKIN